jgi:hypothetical protein
MEFHPGRADGFRPRERRVAELLMTARRVVEVRLLGRWVVERWVVDSFPVMPREATGAPVRTRFLHSKPTVHRYSLGR